MKMTQLPDFLSGSMLIGIFLVSSMATAEEQKMPAHLLLQGGSYSFTAETSTGTSEVSGFGSYSATVGLRLFTKVIVFGSISLLISDGISGDTATGYDLGAKYYFGTSSGRNIYSSSTVNFDLLTRIRPYAGIAIRQRQFTEVLSSSYIGPGVTVGVDYQIQGNWYLNGEVRYSTLAGNADNTLTIINMMLGLGLQL